MDEQMLNIVTRAMGGDRQAREELCDNSAESILRRCIGITRSRADGEDAAQEVLIKLYAKIPSLKNAETYDAWLGRIITSTCTDMARKNRREKGDLPLTAVQESLGEWKKDFLPAQYLETEEKRQKVVRALQGLPRRYSRALVLYYYRGLSQRQVAVALGVNEANARKILERARKALRRALEEEDDTLFAAWMPVGFGVPVLSRLLYSEAGTLPGLHIVEGLAASSESTLLTGCATAIHRAVICAVAVSLGVGITAAFLFKPSTAHGDVADIPLAQGQQGSRASPVGGAYSEPLAGQHAPGSVQSSYALPHVQAAQATSSKPPGSSQPNGPAQVNASDSAGSNAATGATSPPAAQSTSGTSSPSSTFATSPPVVQTIEASGQVVLLDKQGNPLEAFTHYAEGLCLTLLVNGQEAAETVVEADGSYRFTLPAQQGGALQIQMQGTQHLQFAGETAEGLVDIAQYTHGTLPTLYYTDAMPPTGVIRLYNQEGSLQRSLRNPYTAQVFAKDYMEVTISWELICDEQAIESGAGSRVTLQGLPATPEGLWYTLCYTVTDIAGNTTRLERSFLLVE